MPIGLLTDVLLWKPLRLEVFAEVDFDIAIIKFFVNLGVHLGVPILHEVAVNLPP